MTGLARPFPVEFHEAFHFLDGGDRLFLFGIFLLRGRPRAGSKQQGKKQHGLHEARHGNTSPTPFGAWNGLGVNASAAMPREPGEMNAGMLQHLGDQGRLTNLAMFDHRYAVFALMGKHVQGPRRVADRRSERVERRESQRTRFASPHRSPDHATASQPPAKAASANIIH